MGRPGMTPRWVLWNVMGQGVARQVMGSAGPQRLIPLAPRSTTCPWRSALLAVCLFLAAALGVSSGAEASPVRGVPNQAHLTCVRQDGTTWRGSSTVVFFFLSSYASEFPDVPPDHWAFEEIMACVSAGIVTGYPDGTYRPDTAVSRDQMAIYTARALAGGDAAVPTGPADPTFPDVASEGVTYRYIEYAVANEIVFGYPDGLYHPERNVDRGQMAVFIARAMATPTGETGMSGYEPTGVPTFPDVTRAPTDPFRSCYKYVEYIAEQGVTHGYPDGLYHPAYIVSRGLMAIYVARAFALL